MSKRDKTTAVPSKKKQSTVQRYKTRAQREHETNRVVLIAFVIITVVIVGILGTALIIDGLIKPNTVVAAAGGQTISGRDLQLRTKFERWRIGLQLANIRAQYGDSLLSNPSFGFANQYQALQFPSLLAQQVANELLDTLTIRQYASKNGITVSQDEIDAELYDYFQFKPTPGTSTPTATFTPTPLVANTATPLPPTATPLPAGTPTPVPPTVTPTPLPTGAPAPTLSVTEQFKNYQDTAKRYYEEAAKKTGFSESDIRQLMKDQALRKKVMKAAVKEPPKTEYQKRVRHILVGTLQEATDVMIALQKGEPFAALAQAVSIDPGSKTQGGDLGWAGRDAGYVAEFEATLWGPQATVGAILGPIDTTKYSTQDKKYGFHIIQITEENKERPVSESQGQQLQEKAFQVWLNQQRQSINAETYGAWLDFVPSTPTLTELGLPESLQSSTGF